VQEYTSISRQRSTLQGLGAIGLWSSLAAVTAAAGAIPPFQMTAISFALGTIAGLAFAIATRQSIRAVWRTPAKALALGVYGLLGYHVCYFYALQNAPPVEANLINYLWPLLIVLFSGLLPASAGGKRLTVRHILGAALGFAGTALALLSGGAAVTFSGAGSGYLAALAAAVIWSSYSVASRLLHAVPSTSVIATCALTSLGAAAIHLATETTATPHGPAALSALLFMGLGPVGLAFYLWDAGMKRGDITVLGVLSYATPLASTALLAVSGYGATTPGLWLGALLVTAGALVATLDPTLLGQKKRAP
jgi:drug/metabolite transporter (DMT)-like permease